MQPQLNAIGMAVEDMGRTLAFYRRLGLDLPPEADRQPHVEFVLPGGLRLLWDTVETIRSFDPDWRPPEGGGPGISLAFDCGTPEAVDRTYQELTSLGYEGHRPPWDAFWGQRYAVVRDPDGNGVDLFAAREDEPPPAE
jgi:catechol 2,3-dioxygenase-like lactoylglutathione lyase family enzyme